MDNIFSWESLAQSLERVYVPRTEASRLRNRMIDFKCSDQSISISTSEGELLFLLEKSEAEEAFEFLREVEVESQSDFFWEKGCEVHLRTYSTSPYGAMLGRLTEEVLEDNENSVSYELGRPSLAYLIYQTLTFRDVVGNFSGSAYTPMILQAGANRINAFKDEYWPFLPLGSTRTLQIMSEQKRSKSSFRKFVQSFVFQVAYSSDVALIPTAGFDYMERSRRLTTLRRSGPRGPRMEPPYRSYKPDLVHNYQLAVAAGNPFLEYLSYYQIVEHFFESVFSEHIVSMTRETLSSPDFSMKRKSDIEALIKKIEKANKQKREDGGGNEGKTLPLVFMKYIDLEKLCTDLEKFDPDLISYYKENKVSFCDAGVVDLLGNDRSEICKRLAVRVYSTRNALVHAKDGSRPRFIPFRHDRDLSKEIPLMRLIAEQVMIKESDLLR
ncbi:hypothetical protein ABZ645_22875 [Nocardiopsis alba]|uniref:hypothetical protein n=1 Tax=Nocardiopsis alba TaxID=53437 RepID=UPI0033D96801